MKFFTSAAATLALLPYVLAALRVETPGGVQVCRPTKIIWSDDQNNGPYFLALITPGDQNNPTIKDFGQVTGNEFTWNVDLPPNTGFVVKITDKTGTLAVSGPATIAGDLANASCVNTSVAGSGSAGSGPQPSTPAGTVGNTATPSPTTTGASAPSSPRPSSSGSGAAPSTSPSNAAGRLNAGSISLLGFLGFAGAAVL